MIKNIIFDWSGTLSDDLLPTYKASMNMFKKAGLKLISLEEFRKKFRLPWMDLCREYFPDYSDEQIINLFKEGFNNFEESDIYPGVKEVLRNFYEKGFKIIVLSSTNEKRIKSDIKRFGIDSYFQGIRGDVDDKTKTIFDILQKNNFKKEETILIGDVHHDIDAAKEAGIMSVGIYWGYKTKEELELAKPDYLIGDIKELESIIASI